jgi:hypothetical protein
MLAVIVWIDSFFELWCYGAMLWFSQVRDSWWNRISFTSQNFTSLYQFIKVSIKVSEKPSSFIRNVHLIWNKYPVQHALR